MKLAAILLLFAQLASFDPLEKYRESAKAWEKDIAAFEKLDRENRDPENAILFTGSSSIRLWETMAEDMKPWPTIRRGYGGAKFHDLAIYAERSDISEEIVRLGSHLQQFETIMAAEDSAGRKLEFLTQEMLREINTIGSKSSDVEIARHVIEIKATIERLREMIQNVE